MVGEVAVRGALQVVVVGVLREPAVHEGPREVVDRVLLVLDGLCDRLGAHVVVQEVIEVRLDREGLVEELAVEELLRRMAEQHAFAIVIDQRAARAADHLQDVGDGVVGVPVLRAVEELRVHQHREVRRRREAPAHGVRHHEHLHRAALVQREHRLLLCSGEALVEEADAVGEHVVERALGDLRQQRRHVTHLRVQEALGLVVGGRVGQQVDRSEQRLLGGWHEDERRLLSGVVDHGIVSGLRHGEQPRRDVRDIEALDVDLEGHGAHVRVKVEDPVR
mmetsp:Transcript_35800/g.83557  ORF Transcript_35800/g.83557 Transcript_35800/m.83557 type:complete len:278 (-) Transcript_35800:4673-5506(-)